MRIVAGIDPGLDGGVAVYDGLDTLDTAALPTMGESKRLINSGALARWLDERDVTEAIIEEVHAFPDQGVTGVFRFGMAYGQLLGVLQCCLIPYVTISPARWKRHYGLLNSKKQGIVVEKDDSRRKAIELFPKHAAQFALKKDINRAEAALLALYGYQV